MGESAGIDVREVSKVFGAGADAVHALDRVTVAIRGNEFFTLLGPSGCGKTTLLRLIAGFDTPTEGTILLEGRDISLLPPYSRPVNTVFQSYALFPHMTVAGNISFGLEMLGKPKRDVDETVDKMLQLVQMQNLRARRVSEISGGQQQRVALARALAPHPRVLLLDEPLSALDYKLRKEMQIELKRLQHETGITFIFVTHDQEEALTMSDRIAVMNHGKILQIGPPREIYNRPAERFVADFIGDTNFLKVQVTSVENAMARIDLPSGKTVGAALSGQEIVQGPATVVIRPEHARLTKEKSEAALTGTLENIVYIGTDTQYHLQLAGGTPFVVRMQNRRDSAELFQQGEELGIQVSDDAVQVLSD